MSRPAEEIHWLELAGRPAEPEGGSEILDPRSRREIGARVHSLQEELDEAEAANDHGRAERAREELDALAAEMARTWASGAGLGAQYRGLRSLVPGLNVLVGCCGTDKGLSTSSAGPALRSSWSRESNRDPRVPKGASSHESPEGVKTSRGALEKPARRSPFVLRVPDFPEGSAGLAARY